jgi:hypothetical protein
LARLRITSKTTATVTGKGRALMRSSYSVHHND